MQQYSSDIAFTSAVKAIQTEKKSHSSCKPESQNLRMN